MYRFKPAETEAELDQIFRLNHAVFAGELRQHSENDRERLIDKFHTKNRYWIAETDGRVIGMIAAHDEPPYSVADRLADPGILARYGRVAEVRLLAIDPAHRNGKVIAGLFMALYEGVRDHDALAISGVVEECAMYRRLGFRDLGPPVRSGQAEFVPMIVPLAHLAQRQSRWRRFC